MDSRTSGAAAATTRPPAPSDATPALIKRNTLWLALCQMFVGTGFQFVFALGPLMVVALAGSSTLAGLSVALQAFSRFLAAYPFGRVTDRFGRRPGLFLGLVVALAGTIFIGWAMSAGSLPGFIAGLLVFGVGMNGVLQLRLAAAEMYLPHRRAVVIGYVLTGSLVGVVVSPALVGLAGMLAPILSMDPLALPWLFMPVLILPGMVMITRVRPDPKEIAAHLERYYPGYEPSGADAAPFTGSFGLRRFLAHPQRRLAAVAMFSAQGSMQVAMVTAPLALTHHGAALPSVALSMALHSAGMFGPSLPMGRLADRIGRRTVLVLGTIVEAVGGGIAGFTSDQASVTLGIFLVGVGWCAANVASTAIVVDSTPAPVRGRAIGMTDTIGAVAGVGVPLAVGPLVEAWGIGATGVFAMLLMLPPALLFLTMGSLREAVVTDVARVAADAPE